MSSPDQVPPRTSSLGHLSHLQSHSSFQQCPSPGTTQNRKETLECLEGAAKPSTVAQPVPSKVLPRVFPADGPWDARHDMNVENETRFNFRERVLSEEEKKVATPAEIAEAQQPGQLHAQRRIWAKRLAKEQREKRKIREQERMAVLKKIEERIEKKEEEARADKKKIGKWIVDTAREVCGSNPNIGPHRRFTSILSNKPKPKRPPMASHQHKVPEGTELYLESRNKKRSPDEEALEVQKHVLENQI